MSDYEPRPVSEDDFADLANDVEDDFDRYDREAIASWTSREWGPE